jgi:hypothetical protein
MQTILFPPGLYFISILFGIAAGAYTVYNFFTGETETPAHLRLQMFFIIFICFLFAVFGLLLPAPLYTIIWLIESFVLSVVATILLYIVYLDHIAPSKPQSSTSNALAELPALEADPVEAKIIDILKKNRK